MLSVEQLRACYEAGLTVNVFYWQLASWALCAK
jgi:hypothetical protein